MPPARKILLVDDDDSCRGGVAQWLREDGWDVVESADGGAAQTAAVGCDVALVDYHLPDIDGFEVLRRLRARYPELQVVMLTGVGSVEHAVEAMKRGAYHYATKPVDLERVGNLVANAAAVANARKTVAAQGIEGDPTATIVGRSDAIERVRSLIRRIGHSPGGTVLITGESGTGKDLAARALHAVGPRAGSPFMNITCTALPNNLLESELFGHERGAFTDAKSRRLGLFEQAQGGTVFLDEIGDMEPALQAKLLRVLEERRFRRVGGVVDIDIDVRVVAATNVDLAAAVTDRRFREDLYYRLAVLILDIPPLRTRREDIEPLVEHFAGKCAADLGVAAREFSAAAMRALRDHDWPGNVRELRNVVQRAVVLAEHARVEVEDLQLARGTDAARDPGSAIVDGKLQLPADGVDLRALENDLVAQALQRTGGNITQAARLLGMTRDQVRYRAQKLGLVE